MPGANQFPSALPFLQAFERAIAEGTELREAGHCREALPVFRQAEQRAREAGDVARQGIAAMKLGGCEVLLLQYRAARDDSERAESLARQANDKDTAGAAAIVLAQVYMVLGDSALSERNLQDAIRLLSGSPRQDLLVRAWVSYAIDQVAEGKISEGKQSFDRAIAIAQNAKLPPLEAFAVDMRGTSSLLAGRVDEAEPSLEQALAIRERIHDKDGLSISLEHRAELELKQRKYALGLKDVDAAFASAGPFFKAAAPYYPIHIRGEILLGLGRKSEALSEFDRAVHAATTWRQSAMPGDASSTETVAFLHDVYQDYAELAAELALERHDAELARRAFEALAENRAASLREQLTLVLSRNSRLPQRYFDLLSDLEAAQARVTLGEKRAEDEEKLRQIRLDLSNLQDQIGLEGENLSLAKEKNTFQNSLRNIQLRLGKSDLLLSFCLGKRASFLWAITGDDVNLYRLPAENDIVRDARAFSDSVRYGKNNSPAAFSFSRDLFAKLAPSLYEKKHWLITADGSLLSGVPFAALPDLGLANSVQPLMATHTIRSLASELLVLSPDTTDPQKRFVGIADPIYNLADSRRPHSLSFVKTADKSAVVLGRLVGSEREIATAAKQSGMPEVQLLTGGSATSTALESAIARTPEILHFAVHVVSPEGQPEEAALALSLTKENIPELLTREVVAAYRVPGSLVVLSGCSSDQGRALPSAGLIGLSRAWLLAGAAAVVVSAWPTADDSGEFFSEFYRQFQAIKSGSLPSRAAAALQQAQLQMQRSNGHRSSPSFWAAYSIVSKE